MVLYSGSQKMTAPRAGAKSPAAFRTISEVSDDLDVPQHVLRFWETKFGQVRPMKRAGGRRYYRPEDVDLLRRIRDLLYGEGYTIKGVQRLLREGRSRPQASDSRAAEPAKANGDAEQSTAAVSEGRQARLDPQTRADLESLLSELSALRDMLRSR